MEKLNEILSKIVASLQVISNAVISLLFQPIFYLVVIIEGIIDVWTVDEDDEEEEQPQQNVTTYPSTNEGRYAEECDLPIGRQRIGFHTSQHEVDELNKIREELNK